MKNTILHGLLAGILCVAAAIAYNVAYCHAMMADFSAVINIPKLVGINLSACLLASFGYYFFTKVLKPKTDTLFNFVFILISFATFIPVFLVSLPLDVQSPELFIGLAVPMHLFPVVFWLGAKPVFGDYIKNGLNV